MSQYDNFSRVGLAESQGFCGGSSAEIIVLGMRVFNKKKKSEEQQDVMCWASLELQLQQHCLDHNKMENGSKQLDKQVKTDEIHFQYPKSKLKGEKS